MLCISPCFPAAAMTSSCKIHMELINMIIKSSDLPAERRGAGSRKASRPGGSECGGRGAGGVEIGAADARAGAQRPGRGGHGGRCCVHGRDRSLRVPANSAPPDPAAVGAPWGVPPAVTGVGVAHSYPTPVAPWHTIWRTLANPGE